jgi:hypothetical protein
MDHERSFIIAIPRFPLSVEFFLPDNVAIPVGGETVILALVAGKVWACRWAQVVLGEKETVP